MLSTAPKPAAPSAEPVPPFELMRQITAYRTSQCIRAVVELAIPALLEETPRTAADLAVAAHVKAPLLARLLDHLVAEGLFERDDQGRYAHTQQSRYLIPGHPRSMHAWVSCELHPLYWRSWETIVDQLRTGQPGFDLAHGQSFFEQLATDAAAQSRFDEQMRGAAMAMGAAAVQELSFAGGETIVDVGGGDGSFLAQLLHKTPGTTGILFELQRTAATYNPLFEEMRGNGRATVEAGSFFETIPAGGDVYVFSRVFHDFDDAAVAAILRTARAAMTGREKLIIVDILADASAPPGRGSSQDIFMMVQLGGRERTAEEFTAILQQEGFAVSDIRPTASPLSILEFRTSP